MKRNRGFDEVMIVNPSTTQVLPMPRSEAYEIPLRRTA